MAKPNPKPPVDTEELRRRADLTRRRLQQAADRVTQQTPVGRPGAEPLSASFGGDVGREVRDLGRRFAELADAAKKARDRMEEARDRIGEARDRQFDAADPSKPKRKAQEKFDEEKAIRAMGAEFEKLAADAKKLGDSTKALAEAEAKLAKAERDRERAIERQRHYYEEGRHRLGHQLSASGVPGVGSAAHLGQAFRAGPGGAAASKAGIAAAVLGVVQEVANVAATVVGTMNQRTALRGESAAAGFRGDAVAKFRAETEKTAVVLEKIPLLGNLLAEGFRKTAVELEAFKKALDAAKDRADELAPFSPDIIRARVEGSIMKLQQRMQEAQKFGPDYADFIRKTNEAEVDLANEMAGTNKDNLQSLVGQINDKFAILLGEEKTKQANAQKGLAKWDVVSGGLEGYLMKQLEAAKKALEAAKRNAGLLRGIGGDVAKIARGTATDQIGQLAKGLDLGPEAPDPAREAKGRIGAPFLQQPQ